MHHNDNLPEGEPTDATTMAKLRFLADIAIDMVGKLEKKALVRDSEPFRIVPQDASEEMLRMLLRLAVPVLEEADHMDLANQIRKVLREG